MFDEQLYLIAYNDFAGKAVDEALWIKAMTLAGGDKKRAKWHYIELRVDQMLRDPSLRKSVQRKINPTSTSGAYMIWISFIIALGLIGIATSFDFMNMEFNLVNLTYLRHPIIIDHLVTCSFPQYFCNLVEKLLA